VWINGQQRVTPLTCGRNRPTDKNNAIFKSTQLTVTGWIEGKRAQNRQRLTFVFGTEWTVSYTSASVTRPYRETSSRTTITVWATTTTVPSSGWRSSLSRRETFPLPVTWSAHSSHTRSTFSPLCVCELNSLKVNSRTVVIIINDNVYQIASCGCHRLALRHAGKIFNAHHEVDNRRAVVVPLTWYRGLQTWRRRKCYQ